MKKYRTQWVEDTRLTDDLQYKQVMRRVAKIGGDVITVPPGLTEGRLQWTHINRTRHTSAEIVPEDRVRNGVDVGCHYYSGNRVTINRYFVFEHND